MTNLPGWSRSGIDKLANELQRASENKSGCREDLMLQQEPYTGGEFEEELLLQRGSYNRSRVGVVHSCNCLSRVCTVEHSVVIDAKFSRTPPPTSHVVF